MNATHDTIMASLSHERRKNIEAIAEAKASQYGLTDMRDNLGLSHDELAKMQVSTLAGMVEAMGGQLEIVARFPDRAPVTLSNDLFS